MPPKCRLGRMEKMNLIGLVLWVGIVCLLSVKSCRKGGADDRESQSTDISSVNTITTDG